MRFAGTTLVIIVAAAPTTAVACSCGYPEDMTNRQLRYIVQSLPLVAYGRVYATTYPAACRIAPLRWVNAVIGRRAPVTYKLALRKIVWGKSPRNIEVVQYQQVGWAECHPLGDAACQPKLPTGDTLWPLRRDKGELVYSGRCGLIIANYVLRKFSQSAALNVR